MSYNELELRIQWTNPGKYEIAGRYIDPEDDRETELIDREPIEIDHASLEAVANDPDAYGASLSRMVFGASGSRLHVAYEKAVIASQAPGKDGLRVRLHIQKGAPELHALLWELIHVPGEPTAMLRDPRIWFSRFLSADDLRPRPLQDPDHVQMLVAVANPSDLVSKWKQPEIVAEDEYDLAAAALVPAAGAGQRLLTSRPLSGRVSIFDLVASLRDDPAEILYLVCHGTITEEGGPRLLLEAEDGTGEVVRGEELVERLVTSGKQPRLIVLASCKSAGGHGAPGLMALAPRLAQAGVPHVLAMQGNVSIHSARSFMQRFFTELALHGQIDKAVAAARFDILDAPDWWMPALYTHSRRGMVWPPRSLGLQNFHRWNALVSSLQARECLPVLGPGLVDSVIGSTRELARAWADRYEIPLARNRDDLAQVAQHLAYQNDPEFVQDSIRAYVVRYLRSRFDEHLDDALRTAPIEKGLVDKMISRIGERMRATNPNEVHAQLARMPVKIYINANRDNLLRDALIANDKKPVVRVCSWKGDGEGAHKLPAGYEPSVEEPLIFHVFGNFDNPDRLIITEDDYFEFLMGVTRNETKKSARIPPVVTKAIAKYSWLMLGFQIEDWDFRVVLSSVMRQPGNEIGDRTRTSVAIQMNLTDEGVAFDRTADYLARYFTEYKRVNLFWSSPEAFISELATRYERAALANRIGVPA